MKKKVQILGGGATGRLAAIALADRGCEVHLVESPSLLESLPGKILALNLATLDFLNELHIRFDGAPINQIGIYAADDQRHIFMPGLIVAGQDVAENQIGALLGKTVSQETLFAALGESLKARGISPDRENIKEADLTICARSSPASSFCQNDDYGQTALTGMISHDWPHENMAVQFFFPDGPLALLPLENNQSAFIWTRKDKAAKNLLSLDEKKFLLFLRQHLPVEKQAVALVGEIHAHRLRFFFASKWAQNNELLIGEAAHIVHPLAGQGWNICAEDVRLLANMIGDADFLGLEALSSMMLADYQRRRFAHGGALSRAIDLLAHFPFLSGSAAAALLDVIALSKPLRRLFAHAGAGQLQSSFRASSTSSTGMPSRTG